jgi:potassium/hydrogen antiporter
LHLEYDGLYIVVYVALAPAIFSLVSLGYGNGFLAVYVAGATLGNAKIVHQRSAVRFMDGAVWLLNIGCFLMLGLLVFPLKLAHIALPGALLALCMIFVARPLAVFLSLAPIKLDWRSKLFIAWAGLRGAAPIILATFPMAAGVVGAERIFNIVFFVVLLSLLIQGSTLPHVSRWLRLETRAPRRSLYPFEYENREGSDSRLEEFLIPYGAAAVGRSVIEAGLPDDALIVLIARGESYIAPSGRTLLASGDVLLVLVNDRNFPAVKNQLTGVAATNRDGAAL